MKNERYERLCAYVLGEADAAERARMEAELAGDPELLAEKARLERTIELVQGTFEGPEHLSDESVAEILRRAERGARPGPRLLPPAVLRAAAALVVLGGVWAAVATFTSRERPFTDSDLAKLEGERPAEARGDARDVRSEPPVAHEGARATSPDLQKSKVALELVEESLPAEIGSKSERELGLSAGLEDRLADAPSAAEAPSDGAAAGEADHLARRQGSERSGERRQAQSDDFFLGRGLAAQGQGNEHAASKESVEGLRSLGYTSGEPEAGSRMRGLGYLDDDSSGDAYRGPSDSFPPGGGGLAQDDAVIYTWADTRKGPDARARPAAPHLYDGPPELEGARLEAEIRRLLDSCRRGPRERPRDMYFRFWGDNAPVLTELDRLATFAVDVDTASYALVRATLERGYLPEKAQVRTEEFVNWFAPDLDPPAEGTFRVHTELAPSRFGGLEERWMLRVGVRGKEVARSERKPLSLVFVVDTSGSMREDGRLELVKHAVRLLVGELDARDSIGLVAFSDEARLILPLTSAAQRGLIETALHPLAPRGSTNAEAGLMMGYELALGALDPSVHTRVVFLSDGVANVGQTDQDRIAEAVAGHRRRGVYLNTIGVGLDNHNDVFLEQLADKGDGICDYVDGPEAARRAIVERFTGAFEPIASDVKIQVEFDQRDVHRWRLLGYENRAIADADFRNDAVDAGEVGAGHQVVALFELERTGASAVEAPLATVRLRWKAPKAYGQDPNEVDVTEIEHAVRASDALGSFATASRGYRRSVLAAQFAEVLRRSRHALGDSYAELVNETRQLARETGDAELEELLALELRAAHLGLLDALQRRGWESLLDEYRDLQIRCSELEELGGGEAESMERLRRRSAELEELLTERLDEVLRR